MLDQTLTMRCMSCKLPVCNAKVISNYLQPKTEKYQEQDISFVADHRQDKHVSNNFQRKYLSCNQEARSRDYAQGLNCSENGHPILLQNFIGSRNLSFLSLLTAQTSIVHFINDSCFGNPSIATSTRLCIVVITFPLTPVKTKQSQNVLWKVFQVFPSSPKL